MNQTDIDSKNLAVAEGQMLSTVHPPAANWRIYFCPKQKDLTYFQFYLEKPPNCFQRWMIKVCMGIYWEKVK